jgi:hypothetical protein
MIALVSSPAPGGRAIGERGNEGASAAFLAKITDEESSGDTTGSATATATPTLSFRQPF